MATFVQPDLDGYIYAGKELRAGRLIAFPTETVYGLGANALDPEAVLSIFKAKGRPLTDPLIVHVPTLTDALDLVDLTPKGRLVFECLGRAFWPGPLTLIAKATAALPLTVSAHTGFVGIRCPAHPIAQALLQEAKVPVAAPSANRFGHVSPTSAQHVMDDLGACSNIGIVDDRKQTKSTCQVGIESTVVKIIPESNQLMIYRRGGVSEAALALVLQQHAVTLGGMYEIVTVQRTAPDNSVEAQPAPGQLLTHYAPDVETYLYQPSVKHVFPSTTNSTHMKKWVVLDFNGQLASVQHSVLAYHDLSRTGNVVEASQHIFEYLRWAEHVEEVERVVITDVLVVASQHEHAPALHDRMFRAASGRIVHTLDS